MVDYLLPHGGLFMARKKGDVADQGIITEVIEETVRPTSVRGRWSQDETVASFVRKVIESADTGKAYKARISEAKFLGDIRMHIRHHVTTGGKNLQLHTQALPDGWLRAWAEYKK